MILNLIYRFITSITNKQQTSIIIMKPKRPNLLKPVEIQYLFTPPKISNKNPQQQAEYSLLQISNDVYDFSQDFLTEEEGKAKMNKTQSMNLEKISKKEIKVASPKKSSQEISGDQVFVMKKCKILKLSNFLIEENQSPSNIGLVDPINKELEQPVSPCKYTFKHKPSRNIVNLLKKKNFPLMKDQQKEQKQDETQIDFRRSYSNWKKQTKKRTNIFERTSLNCSCELNNNRDTLSPRKKEVKKLELKGLGNKKPQLILQKIYDEEVSNKKCYTDRKALSPDVQDRRASKYLRYRIGTVKPN